MATLIARMTVLCTGAKEGTGPTLVLTTAKRGMYSSEETAVEVLWFNCGECACRVANERHLKLSCSSAVCYTRVNAAHVSGTPSLLFHLSTAGVQALPLHGPRHMAGTGTETRQGGEEDGAGAVADGQPHKRARMAAEAPGGPGGRGGQGGLLTSYISAVNTFVHRQYPSVSVHEHGVEHSVADAPRPAGAAASAVRVGSPILVHDSRGTGVYAGMPSLHCPPSMSTPPGAGTGSSRPGLRVWALPVQLPFTLLALDAGQARCSRASLACYAVHIHAHALGASPGQGQGAWLAVLDWPSRGGAGTGAGAGTREEEGQGYEAMRQEVLQAIQTLHCGGCAAAEPPEVTVYHLNHPTAAQAQAQAGASTLEPYTHFPAAARHAAALHASCPLLFPAAPSLGWSLSSTRSASAGGASHGVSVERPGPAGELQAQPQPRLYTPAGHTLQQTGPVAAAPAPPAVEAPGGDGGVGASAYVTGGAQVGEVQAQGTGWQELQQACTLIRPPSQPSPAAHTAQGRANQDAAAALRRSLLSAPPSGSGSAPVPAVPRPSSAGQASLHPMPFTSRPGTTSTGAGLTLLGTGAAAPSTLRSCSALWLRLPHPSPLQAQEGHDGVGLLLDCGEGALSRLDYNPSTQLAQLASVWVSHMHADHHTGLMSVLAAYMRCRATSSSSSASTAYTPVPVSGPAALSPVLATYCRLIREQAQEEGWCWWPSAHRGPAAAADGGGQEQYEGIVTFTPIQRSPPVPVSVPMGGMGQQQGPLCKATGVQHWEDVPVLHHGEAYGCVLAWCSRAGVGGLGHVLCYSGDTRPCAALVSACAGAVQRMQGEGRAEQGGDLRQIRVLLVHEATFAEGADRGGPPGAVRGGETEDEACSVAGSEGAPGHGRGQGGSRSSATSRMSGRDHAIRKRHSTAEEAVGIFKQLKDALSSVQGQGQGEGGGAAAEVVLLPPILTHFSARYAAEGDIRGRSPTAGPGPGPGPVSVSGLGQCLVTLSGMQVLMASDGVTLPL